jgi:hypothetical protein
MICNSKGVLEFDAQSKTVVHVVVLSRGPYELATINIRMRLDNPLFSACAVNARRVGGSRERAPGQRRRQGNPVRIA